MQVERADGARERRILTGMITDKTVLAAVAPKWDGELFPSPWSNLVGGWCVDYFQKYGEAPGKEIEGLYEAWVSDGADPDTAGIIHRFLGELSSEYKRLKKEQNPRHLIDQAGAFFTRVQLSSLSEKIKGLLSLGHVDKAEKLVHTFKKVEVGQGAGIDLLTDTAAIRRVFDQSLSEPLFEYRGGLGDFFGPVFERDGFVAFMGREKIGKTWWLIDVAWRALLARRRVAFFQVGDLSERQITSRFLSRAAAAPIVSRTGWPLVLKHPRSITKDPGGPAEVEYEEKEYASPLEEAVGIAAFAKVQTDRIRSNRSYFKLSCHPARSLSVAGMKGILRGWEHSDDWVPDMVVVDYADILAPPPGFFGDSRDAINETWIALRALSTELHGCVVTATQAKATAYKAELLDMSDYSEDKRKFSHVTAMCALNQTDQEHDNEVWRLNWLVGREFAYSSKRCAVSAGCLGIANPAVRSIF